VSADLLTLGSRDVPRSDKEAAFLRLRAHFVANATPHQRLTAVQAVDAQLYCALPPPRLRDAPTAHFRLADRIRGLFFGAALGDAAGLATEFMTSAEEEEFYGTRFEFMPQPTKMKPDTHRMMWAPGDWTDDTDQLF
jgi:hypothetical protein